MRTWAYVLVPFAMFASCAIPDIEIVDSFGTSGGNAGTTSAGDGGVSGVSGGALSGRGGVGGDDDGAGGTMVAEPGGAPSVGGSGGVSGSSGSEAGGSGAEGTGGAAGAGGTDVTPPPECESGDAHCTDDEQVEGCVEGAWTITESCAGDTPFCVASQCVSCKPGTTRCTDNAPEECSEDGLTWVRGEPCTGEMPACLAATGTCGRCADGELQCNGDVLQQCDANGTWVDEMRCAGVRPQCLVDRCVECDPSEGSGRRCLDAATPQVCTSEGSYQSETPCSGSSPTCRDETGRCACRDGDQRCQGNTPQRCSGGLWTNLPACGGGTPVCAEATGTCVCRDNDTRCTGSVPERCSNGAWQPGNACGGFTPVCSNGACVCRDGDVRCSGSVAERCTGGSFQTVSQCSGATPVCSNGACVCRDGDVRCSGSVAERCTNGAWQARTTCTGDTPVCSNGACVCRDNETRCAPQAGTSARERCSGGSWQTMTACSGTEPLCVRDGQCGCTPGTLRCADPHTVSSCRNDSTWLNTACGTTLSACDQGRCLSPTAVPGYVGCMSGLVCDSDEQCCYHATTTTAECQPDTPIGTTCANTPNDFEYDCDGPNDCPGGQVCCLSAFMRQLTQCIAASSCTGTTNSIVCDPSAGVSNNPVCAAGQSCTGLTNGIIYRCN